MKQQFTIRITTERKEDMAWIWDAMKSGQIINGISVDAISNGDMFKRLDLTNEQLYMLDREIENLQDEDFESFNALEEMIEKTFKREIP